MTIKWQGAFKAMATHLNNKNIGFVSAKSMTGVLNQSKQG